MYIYIVTVEFNLRLGPNLGQLMRVLGQGYAWVLGQGYAWVLYAWVLS